MNGFAKALLFFFAGIASAQQSNVALSVRAPRDTPPNAQANSPFWRDIKGVFTERDRFGKTLPEHRTEVRSRWTDANLYLLFICPYEKLYTKPDPDPTKETNQLWNWDVAEAFLGSDFQNIKRYKEFEVSPHAEWVDLDIDRAHPLPDGGWHWNSGFKVAAQIDSEHHVWYAEMQIPWQSIDSRPPKPGLELRANFYRMEGPPPDRLGITWQPTNNNSFHVPEAFGILRLTAPTTP